MHQDHWNDNLFYLFAVTLGFFDDILIPPTALQHPSRFEAAEQAWVWEYPLEEGATHDLYMDIGETIKFCVSGDISEESSPIGPPNNDKPSTSSQNDIKTPYRILVSVMIQCLSKMDRYQIELIDWFLRNCLGCDKWIWTGGINKVNKWTMVMMQAKNMKNKT